MRHSPISDDRAERQPTGFRVVEGVREAWRTTSPYPLAPVGRTTAQKRGLTYERKAHDFLHATFPGLYDSSPWFKYRTCSGDLRFCSPDGLFLLGNMAVVFEIKSTFTFECGWKLRFVYEPVINAVYRPKYLGICLIVKKLDMTVSFPEPLFRIGRDDGKTTPTEIIERYIVTRKLHRYMAVFEWKGVNQ